ncbi:DEAD/DEAH box helicase [Hungatella effluvii]|uniref:DEAD/DEAH box helicase n=1 Tax=Hungatella effluvii TaxID=1096246 RepID=UPI002A838D73|nr:SNF2 helicase associated domain-containing protein [Hungatella effluvii]
MKVSQMTTSAFWKGESGVKGLVEDQGKQYKANLYIKGSQVYDYSCSCVQGNSYKGMCPHCQELYREYREKAAENSGRPVTTSQQARTMIREYTNREVAQIIIEGEEKQVQLAVRIIADRSDVKLEFRLGRERFYVLKDLVAFTRAVESGSLVEYGKNLAFHHNLSVFAKESRPLVEFIMELVNTYCEHYEQFQKSSFSNLPTLRGLNLSRGNRDRFFSLMMGETLELEDYRAHKRMVTVTDHNPDLAVKVRRKGRDGILVSIDKGLLIFEGERHLYVVDKERIFRCDEACSATLHVFLEQMIKSFGSNCEAEVNDKDMPLFYERVLKKIAAYSTIDAGDVELEAYKPEELKARFEFDSQGPNDLVLKPVLSYGEYSFQPVEDEKLPRTVCRDVPGEFRVSQLITKYFKYKEHDTEYPAIRDDEEAIYRLLTEGMSEFMAQGEVYLSESFKKLKVLPPPKISIGVKSSGSWLELTVDTDGMSGAELTRLLSEYSQKKRYYRMKNGEFLALDDNGLMTVAKLVEGLAVNKSDLQSQKIRLPKYRALYLDGILKEGTGITLYRDALFKAVVRGMKSVEDSDFEISLTLRPVLREYQKTGFRWLKTLDSYGFGGILADDMGLGKTIQVIALLLDERNREPDTSALIVCPASLVYNWENEIHQFAPTLKVRTINGTAQEREELLNAASEGEILVTSYDLLKRDIAFYEEKEFRFQIIDEAQYIKNASTQSAKAVKSVNARTRFALTGTPIENRLSELWSIFDFLMPGFLFSYQRFKKEYELPIVRDQDEACLKGLHRMIGPFIMRRLKKDVLKELPDKLENVIYSGFEKEQKDLYTANAWQVRQQLEQAGDGGSDRIQILAQLTKLRQICCDPHLCYSNYNGSSAKLETCIDLIRNGVEGGHKILLFSQFTSMLEIIEKRLKKEGMAYYILTGATPKEERLHMVNSFKDDGVPVFLISLKAGGTGLNLTAADVVIHYDPWWNVAAQNQATDRTHRIGQEKQVTVFKLITKGTIEENILKLQESKKNLAEQIITEGTVSLGSLTKDDLIGLLVPPGANTPL